MMRIALCLALLGCTTTISEVGPDTDVDVDVDTDTDTETAPLVLEEAVDVDRMLTHLEALQAIADDNGGNRVYLTSGYLDSVDYITETLEAAGLAPRVEAYAISRYNQGVPTVEISAPDVEDPGVVASVLRFSGSGDVEAPVTAVDVQIPPGQAPNSSTSGCEASDFADFPRGNIALIQRGTCRFADKVNNASAAGASAVIVFNEGQSGRTAIVEGVLDDGALAPIPAFGIRFADGRDLLEIEGLRMRVAVETELREDFDQNVLVTIPGRDSSRNLVVGAHLDSVAAGPGINDNGSGTALLLEIAEQTKAANWQPETDVTLAWWGAEEQGLVGSRNWFLDERGEPDLDNLQGIEAYLNFDMLASRNGGRFVYDGDSSSMQQDVSNPGSIYIEAEFERYFSDLDLETRPVGIVDRADSYWAVVLGIPWGGLFSGAEQEKSVREASLFGGEPGVPFDDCYHQECDTLEGVDLELYGVLSRSAASMVQQLAESETPVPSSSGATGETTGGWVPGGMLDLPRPYGCHDDAIFDR